MTVYVDDMRWRARVRHRWANWSHLFADTSEELHAFAAQLGLRREWVQHPGTPREHYDVTDSIRDQALALGATPITYPRDTGALVNKKRVAQTEGD